MTSLPDPTDETVRAPYIIVDDFLPLDIAEAMRSDIDAHFANPDAHRPDLHQVWNYWFVPDLYTYLRTSPERIIGAASLENFVRVLRAWSGEALGLGEVTWPYLSLYVGGCRQSLHNDSENGRFAFVYSLTRNRRTTTGGETIILNEGDLFRANVADAQAGTGLFTPIAPRFNRLVVFDDRMPHGVERVDGSMDPTEGRIVLHGHLRDRGCIVSGALSEQQVREVVIEAILAFSAEALARIRLYHGPVVFRLAISPAGKVEACRVLLDRVTASDNTDSGWTLMQRSLQRKLMGLRFPAAPGPTTLIQPVLLGASLFRPPR
jgi:2OG-Fe(II) oxygenase superfamily